MTNSTNGINTQINIGEQNLETVDSFKYLGTIVSEAGPKPEIMSRIQMHIEIWRGPMSASV